MEEDNKIGYYADELHEIYDRIRIAKTRLLEIVGCCEMDSYDEEVFEAIDDNLYEAKEALWKYVG